MKPVNKTKLISGILFIAGALLINLPYALLMANFHYPDILRQPAASVLQQFAAGGTQLIWTWLAFAWTGLFLLFAMILLPEALGHKDDMLLRAATTVGVISALAQIIGLLRWPFVVPALARVYTDPASTHSLKETASLAFELLNQYGGVVLGEHIGQLFTIFWMILISSFLLKKTKLKSWLGWLGILAAAVYVSAQGELLATVMPSFPVFSNAGLYGSLLWLLWMVCLGINLLRAKGEKEYD